MPKRGAEKPPKTKKLRLRKRHVLIPVIVVAAVMAAFVMLALAHAPGIKSRDKAGLGVAGLPATAGLGSDAKTRTITSPVFKSEFEFNAVAPHWEEEVPAGTSRALYVRMSEDKRKWSEWFKITPEGAVRDDDPHPDMTYADNPLFVKGRHYQYRLELSRESVAIKSPRVWDLTFTYIDSRLPKLWALRDRLTQPAYAADSGPRIISRAEWGSPDPYGDMFKGQGDKYWVPRHAPVKQIFIHHTVSPNYNASPAEVVRGIWQFHTYTRGWGDIGYNYLMDQDGNVYQGRFGGDNVVGGHVYDYNTGSMGVAMIGCYTPTDPTCKALNPRGVGGPPQKMWDGLVNLLAWKTQNYEIDPNLAHVFCHADNTGCKPFWTIAGHRDAISDDCPGTYVYNGLPDVRLAVAQKRAATTWAYSAKQISFAKADLSKNVSQTVTLSFKNNGTATWNNSTNKLLLKTTAPDGRKSVFMGDGWVNDDTAAVLNEAAVPPGGTGTFTFQVKRPEGAYGTHHEYFKLAALGVGEIHSIFALQVDVYCTFGTAGNPRPDGLLVLDGNGRVYRLEGGGKRLVTSPLAALTSRLDLGDVVPVDWPEVNSLPTGAPIGVAEGALIKADGGTAVYVIDDASGTAYKRRLMSSSAMDAFGLQTAKIYSLDATTLGAFPTGTPVYATSDVPDGLLVKSASSPTTYVVESGSTRVIPSPEVMLSFGYTAGWVHTIDQSKVDALAAGAPLAKMRSGSMFKASDSPTTYAADDQGAKRLITTPYALLDAGFNPNKLITTSSGAVSHYADGSVVECHL